ncbi:MAG TPA: 23S rRNA (uracil(1939)-C(5))-methyltransferase RlmD [Clostridiales bacterium]|nr:23S rRNA (uracil(1939)-C(5))-methyltransferase RlmD [Clostridiales bacterium]
MSPHAHRREPPQSARQGADPDPVSLEIAPEITQEVTLEITGISQEGQGIGRQQDLAVFVPGTIPGDRALVQIEQRKSRYAVGRAIKILQPAPDRITPACSRAAACGGCTLQAMAYPAQLAFKQQQVVDALERIGHVRQTQDLTRPILGMAQPWHYRSKVQFPVAGRPDHPEIGFYTSRTHQVIDADACPIQPPVCDSIREIVRRHIVSHKIAPYDEIGHSGLLRHLIVRIGFFTGEVMIILVLNGESLPGWPALRDDLAAAIAGCRDPDLPPLQLSSFYININRERTNLILSEDCRLLAGQPWIEEKLLGLRYRISPLAFFQVNPRQTSRLYAAALELAGLTGAETVLDLYCGTGSITLQLARRAREAIGIEIIAAAIADAQTNALLNDITNVRFLTGAAETVLPDLIAGGLRPDIAVIDPPRKGCDPALIQTLAALPLKRIVYVSCNPATLARDIALLQPAGYRVAAVQPVDMFPWTGHVETVVLMSRVEG